MDSKDGPQAMDKHLEPSLWLEFVYFPLLHVEALTSKVMLGDGTFGNCLSHEIRVLTNEINALIKGPRKLLGFSHHVQILWEGTDYRKTPYKTPFSCYFDFECLSFQSCKKYIPIYCKVFC